MLSFINNKFKTKELSELVSDKEVQSAMKSWLSLNRWSVFLFLILISGLMIFYVSNVLAINKLAEDIRVLEKKEKRIEYRKRMIEAEVIELQSAERICKIAEEKLNMVKSDEFPHILKKINE